MPDERIDVQQTGDLLRPLRTRPSGVRAIAWYGVVAVLATVAVIYLVGIFAAPAHQEPAPTSLIGQADARAAASGDDAFRYSGRVVDRAGPAHRVSTARTRSQPGADRAVSTAAPVTVAQRDGLAQHDAPATGVPPAPGDVPDVSDASASRVRVPLPTAAPDDTVGQRQVPASLPLADDSKSGMVVVYGTARSAGSAAALPPTGALAATPGIASPQPGREEVASPGVGAADVGGSARAALRSETMPGVRRAPLAKYLVPAGTPIAVQLDVALESDVAGPVVAHIVRDVLDPLSGEVVIPGGTKALGDYSGLVAGQSRLSLVWRRLLFPDMSSFALEGVPALDEDGRVGVAGRVDQHDGTLVRRTLFSGLLAEIARRIGLGGEPNANTLVLINTGGTSQPGLPAAILAAADRLNQRDASAPPTVTINANAIVSLYVARDLLFDFPYAAVPPQGAAQ